MFKAASLGLVLVVPVTTVAVKSIVFAAIRGLFLLGAEVAGGVFLALETVDEEILGLAAELFFSRGLFLVRGVSPRDNMRSKFFFILVAQS